MSLPLLNLNIQTNIFSFEEDGALVYKYRPFQNLKIFDNVSGDNDISGLSIYSAKAAMDINTPVYVDTEVSYDDSINLLVNDYKNPLKIVNSRFYLIDSTHYKVADRKGNLDSNIYTEDNFKIEASLIKSVRSISTLDFNGIKVGGQLPVGSYNFYFKLADSDGNETDFIAESGKVVCHIGAINQPSSIRGGILEENSDKLVNFKLNNIDLAYNYIVVYYTRTSGNQDNEYTKTYKVTDKYKITGPSTEVTITGYENSEEIDGTEINIQYASFESAKTNANCQNITFAGNITKNYELFKTLEKYSLFVTPELSFNEDIGNLDYAYQERYLDTGYEYYNANNIYYKLGYWNEEIYRFGIVYILNDFTLSPVFNIRGIKVLEENPIFTSFNLSDEINYGEDFIIERSADNSYPENAKGVFKIATNSKVFNGSDRIRPIGIKFNFNNNVIIGDSAQVGLNNITKGFFIVRQKRIPTILGQALGIGTSSKAFTPMIKDINGYFTEGFLTGKNSNKPMLGRSMQQSSFINNNALLCPEASLRKGVYNNIFNSSEFTLKYAPMSAYPYFVDKSELSHVLYTLGNPTSNNVSDNLTSLKSNLLLVDSGIELINNGNYKFASRVGTPEEAWRHVDLVYGDINSVDGISSNITDQTISESLTKIRGEYNSYIGCDRSDIQFAQYYNIFQKNYDFNTYWKDYFRIRFNDFSPFSPVSDRISWDSIVPSSNIPSKISTPGTYRGDCYINTFSHRMLWNFIDPELPTNTTIVDPWTWYKNYRVKVTTIKNVNGMVIDDTTGTYSGNNVADLFSYKKLLDSFTYKTLFASDDSDTLDGNQVSGLVLPDSRKFKKYSELNGTFGASKMNRPDVNAVPLGHWVTFKVCSNYNLSMRDIDFTRPEEEAIHKMKRGFYPLQNPDPAIKLPESDIINYGISKTLGDKNYFEIPDVPFIKTNFSNRIYYSEVLQEASFKNGNRIFKSGSFQDYTREYGALVKLIEWYGTLIGIMEHGIIMIPVNERAMMTNAQGENVYINTDNVLPKNPKIISNKFGSIWADSIIKTPMYIYGIDTVAKKIWRTNGEKFDLISDMKIQKFLNDNINLLSTDRLISSGSYSIKSHYNAFKRDVLFVFSYGTDKWNLCWNELLNKWITKYTWFPEFSENISNIFYTFANNKVHVDKGYFLYKHGFAGNLEEQGIIYPTKWYDTQNLFEFEFIVNDTQGIQKIFDNLKIISNLTSPKALYYEVVGESFDWNTQKNSILLIGDLTFVSIVDGVQMPVRNVGESDAAYLSRRYETYLLQNTAVKKLPYIQVRNTNDTTWVLSNPRDLTISQDNKTKEISVVSYQQGLDIKTFRRLKGNMEYVEDFWDIQIQPITYKYAYIKTGVIVFTNNQELRIRDKYIRIRVQYDGTQYAIVNALKTLFTLSYA